MDCTALMVPPASGPSRVAWNLALMCRGRFLEAGLNLNRLPENPAVGPLTCWYASRVFGFLNRSFSQKFAYAGLKKLGEVDFRREMDHLLPAESLLSDLVRSVGNAVRQLDDDEFARLTLLLGEEAKNPAVPKMIEQIRQEQGTPSRELLLESLATIWRIRGQAYCREHLENLAGPSSGMTDFQPNKKRQTGKELEQSAQKIGDLFRKPRPRDKKNQTGKDLNESVRKILENPTVLPSDPMNKSKRGGIFMRLP